MNKKENVAHFDLVKQQNRKIIRNLLRAESPLSIAQISDRVGLSYPTVASLLKELTASGETLISQQQNIAGGRPGICYELNPSYQYGMTLYFDDFTLKGKIHDAFGKTIKPFQYNNISAKFSVSDILNIVRRQQEEYPELSTLSIGVPGAVHESEICFLPKFLKLVGTKLVQTLEQNTGLDVLIENDVNAIAFAEVGQLEDFAHIIYVEEDECIGVGIVMQGQIVKGCGGYAGELEYLCKDLKDREDTFVTCIKALTCVLNLPDILLSGDFCSDENLEKIRQKLSTQLPEERIPTLHAVENPDQLYETGLFRRILQKWSEQV
jgi:DNA-binding Lrp family transcriptional regulator